MFQKLMPTAAAKAEPSSPQIGIRIAFKLGLSAVLIPMLQAASRSLRVTANKTPTGPAATFIT